MLLADFTKFSYKKTFVYSHNNVSSINHPVPLLVSSRCGYIYWCTGWPETSL